MKVSFELDLQTFLPARSQAQLNSIRGISSAGRAPGLQPGGHRFEPGILHQILTGCALRGSCAEASGNGGSLTTEYPANGSFFRPHTRSVHEVVAVGSSSEERKASARVSYGQATKGVR